MIFPKLFKRLAEHINDDDGKLKSFVKFLEDRKDYVYILGKFHKQELSELVTVSGKKLSLTENLKTYSSIRNNKSLNRDLQASRKSMQFAACVYLFII